MKSSLDDELARSRDRITAAETELEGFDAAIRAAETEAEAASEYVQQAKQRVNDAEAEKEEIKSGWETKMSERHDLQVLRILNLLLHVLTVTCRLSNVR